MKSAPSAPPVTLGSDVGFLGGVPGRSCGPGRVPGKVGHKEPANGASMPSK